MQPYLLCAFLFLSEETLMNNALHWSYILWDKNGGVYHSSILHVDLRHLCINLLFLLYILLFEKLSMLLYIQTLIWSCVYVSLGTVLWGMMLLLVPLFGSILLGALISIGWRCPNGLHYPYNRFWLGKLCEFFCSSLFLYPPTHLSVISYRWFFAGLQLVLGSAFKKKYT